MERRNRKKKEGDGQKLCKRINFSDNVIKYVFGRYCPCRLILILLIKPQMKLGKFGDVNHQVHMEV